jgi:hypothetical protein
MGATRATSSCSPRRTRRTRRTAEAGGKRGKDEGGRGTTKGTKNTKDYDCREKRKKPTRSGDHEGRAIMGEKKRVKGRGEESTPREIKRLIEAAQAELSKVPKAWR